MRHTLVVALVTAAAVSLAACGGASSNAPDDGTESGRITVPANGNEVTLGIRQSANVTAANLRVTFDSLLSDSRCPTKALIQCVWAGSVRVRIAATPIQGFTVMGYATLETVPGRDTATVLGHPLRLVRVTPERETLDSIPLSQYRVLLTVGPR